MCTIYTADDFLLFLKDTVTNVDECLSFQCTIYGIPLMNLFIRNLNDKFQI